MTAKEKEFDAQVIATTLMGCVQETLSKMYNMSLSKDPEFVEKEIIEYESRMRTFGLEKFNGPCYLAAINFYLSAKHLAAHDALGAMILYIEKSSAVKFLKAMGFNDADEDDEEIILDCSGEFCNVIAGQFKNELSALGYRDLTISAPTKAVNDIVEGVEFCYNEHKFYEISYDLWKQKTLVTVITLAPVALA